MPFIWRQKPDDLAELHIEPEALSCLEAGCVIIDTETGKETFSAQLHHLFELPTAVESWESLYEQLKEEDSKKLEQTVDALRKGQVTAPLLLAIGDERTLVCRGNIAPSDTPSQIGIFWFYDISPEIRQHQRIRQENEKLKNELKFHSTLLNMAPYPIWQRDGSLKIRYYNLAYSEVAEAAETPTDDAPEMDRRARILAKQALDSGTPKKERRHVVVEGQRKLYEMQEFPLSSENMVIGFAQDITEIEEFQSELERYVSAQSDLLESSASAMAIFGSDQRIKTFNYAYVSQWKLDEAWLETHPSYGEILEVLRENRRLPEQANFAQFKQQQLKLFTDLIEPQEEFFYLPDGTTLRVIVIPHAMGGLLFTFEDVTDRLSLERNYNTLIAVQRETLDNLHEGIAVFGEDGRIQLSNPIYHSLWGLPEDIVEQKTHVKDILEHVKDLYYYENWEEFRNNRAAQVQNRIFERRRIERTDGKVIDCTYVPLPDGATLITYIDVTDSTLVERSLREKNEALQAADKLKSEFLANVSYELRSPLTSISGFSEMLSGEYFGELNEKQKEYIEGIQYASHHLMQLVNDILDLASVEAGYLQLDVKHFDIYAVLHSVVPLVAERAKEQEISLSVECDENIGNMIGDDTRMRQVLLKILVNAIKFSPPGSNVTLGAEATEETDKIIFWVKDSGYGIPPEDHEKIFSNFYKGDNATVPKTVSKSGTGLGLSIVKNLIELHGGKVEIESDVGKGTLIRCILPRNNPDLKEMIEQRPKRKKPAKS